jgi:hypothetical protein
MLRLAWAILSSALETQLSTLLTVVAALHCHLDLIVFGNRYSIRLEDIDDPPILDALRIHFRKTISRRYARQKQKNTPRTNRIDRPCRN